MAQAQTVFAVFSSSSDDYFDYLFLTLFNLKHAHILMTFSCFMGIVSSSRIRSKLVWQSNRFFVPLPNLQLHSRIEASSHFPSIYPYSSGRSHARACVAEIPARIMATGRLTISQKNKASVSEMVQEPLFAGNHSMTDPFRPLKSHLHHALEKGLSW